MAAIALVFLVLGNLAAASAQQGAASRFIGAVGSEAIAALRAPDFGQDAREARIRSLIIRAFDLSYIGRFTLGRHWRQATPGQRDEFLRLFGEYVLRTHAARFDGYADVTLAVLSERVAGSRDVVVSTLIERTDGLPIAADWRVRSMDGSYRIIDVMIEGVSMVVTQRSEFAAVIQRRGLDGLIDDLRMRHQGSRLYAAR